MTVLLEVLLLAFLIFCAVAAILCRRLVSSVIIFMAYSAVMSLLWFLLESPDLAVTEAAVGGRGDHPAVFPHPAEDQRIEGDGAG